MMKALILMAIAAFSLSAAHAQTAQQQLFTSFVSYLCHRNGDFEVGRGLNDYGYHLSHTPGSAFAKRLEELPEGAHWFDGGGGNGNAMSDALFYGPTARKHLKMTLVNHENPPFLKKQLERGELSEIEVLHGDYLENMYQHGKLNHLMGKTDLITDVVGVLSYTKHFSEVMKIYSRMLKVGGHLEFSMVIGKKSERNFELVRAAHGGQKLFPESGQMDASIRHYLKQFKGLELTNWRLVETLEGEWLFSAELKKTHEQVMIPDLVSAKYDPRGTPPMRGFSFISPEFEP